MVVLFVLLVVVAVIVIIWYMRKENAGAGALGKGDQPRRLGAPAADSVSGAASISSEPSRTAESGRPERGAGLFQGAADSAAGLRYERAADQMEGITAELARARQDAEQAAQRLASRADEALASIQTAAAAHGGAVPGDGTLNCPSRYPVKGTRVSMLYHEPGQPSYNQTIPDVCFQSAEAAEAAGFTGPGDEAGVLGGPVVAEEVVAEDVSSQPGTGDDGGHQRRGH